MIYAVIDTNVLVSALITHNSLSATAKVVRLLLDGEFTPLYESSIIEVRRINSQHNNGTLT